MIQSLCVVLLVFAVADFIGVKTKSLLSGPFVALFLFVVLFQLEWIPTDIIARAGLTDLAKISFYLFMVDMGTMIDVHTLKREWRTAVMAALSVLFTVVGVLCIAPLIGREAALTAIPVISGNLQAAVLILDAATEKGLTMAYTLGIICYAVKKFVGTVVASTCGRGEAQRLVEEHRAARERGEAILTHETAGERKPAFWERHRRYYTNPTLLAIVAVLAVLSALLQDLTGVSYSIYCLVFGFAARNMGLLPEKPLTQAKAFGLLHVGCFSNLIPSLATIDPADIVSMALPLVLVFGAVLVSTFLFVAVLPLWRIVGSRRLACGICMSQMLGFPPTMLVANEIVSVYAETPEETAYLEQKLVVPYVFGGLVSATILSIALAGVCAGLL